MSNIFEDWVNESDAFDGDDKPQYSGTGSWRDAGYNNPFEASRDGFYNNTVNPNRMAKYQRGLTEKPRRGPNPPRPQRESRHQTRQPFVNDDSRYDGDGKKPQKKKQIEQAHINAIYYGDYDNTPTVSGGAAFLIVVLAFMVVVGLITMF